MNLNPAIIKKIIESGHQVLHLPEIDELWIVNTFQTPRSTGVETTEFCLVKGFELTEYFEKYHASIADKNFIERLENHIADLPVLTMKFAPNIKWKLYITD